MKTVLWLLGTLGLLGAFDTIYFHEIRGQLPAAPVKIFRRSPFMARMRSLTEPYIVSRPPDRTAAVVMSTTGATIAWIAVMAVGSRIQPTSGAPDRTLVLDLSVSCGYALVTPIGGYRS